MSSKDEKRYFSIKVQTITKVLLTSGIGAKRCLDRSEFD
jgi:hypothetical protein